MAAPVLIKPIPSQIVNELGTYGPFKLDAYLQAPDGEALHFRAELVDGRALPKGLICMQNGIVTGIPAKKTMGVYEILVTAENEAGEVQTTFTLTIKTSLVQKMKNIDALKAEVWKALENKTPLPDLDLLEAYGLPITIAEVYYLLERFSAFKIWDVFNLEPPGELVPLQLPGASPHFHVYDRGSCLVMTPKELFSHERTLEDGLQTARAMIREVYKRNWTIELVGFQKLTRAAWLEAQRLGAEMGRYMEVINYEPGKKEVEIYQQQNPTPNTKPDMD